MKTVTFFFRINARKMAVIFLGFIAYVLIFAGVISLAYAILDFFYNK